tara:strand:+ start:4341 stop:4862 length:522 start_codon:yes stop_codon:yes gene_type:complete
MPDGLELFPLDGGKLELLQDLFDAADDEQVNDEDLGYAVIKMYASPYKDLRDLEMTEIVDQGRELSLSMTLEDKQAAEDVILADFDALQASVAKNPKGQARIKEARRHSDTLLTSGPDSQSDTVEANSTGSPASRLSRSSSPSLTQTETTKMSSDGFSLTGNNSKPSETASLT